VDRALRPVTGPQAGGAYVVRVEPPDGAAGVFRDGPVLVRVSQPLDRRSLSGDTVSVVDAFGAIPARIELSVDAHVVIWRPERSLLPCLEHRLEVRGLRDRSGSEVPAHVSRFFPGGLSSHELPRPSEEEAC
jgi:hypothetical protein